MKVRASGTWSNSASGRRQWSLLMERVNEIGRVYRDYYDDEMEDGVKEPKAVRDARRLVTIYDEKKRRDKDKLKSETERACSKARREITFAKTPDEALEALQKLEVLAEKKGWIKE